MEESGLVDIQCHALTHTRYFKGPRIVDFWHPGAATERRGPVWMLWNRLPQRKPFYLTEAPGCETAIPYGTPIYEHGKSLETRRYYPGDGEVERAIQEYIVGHGGNQFFEKSDWRADLYSLVERCGSLATRSSQGYYESHEAYCERVRCELSQSKERIERELQKTIHGLCWPGGGVNEEVVRIAREVGFRYFTLPSQWKRNEARCRYADMIARIGSLQTITVRGKVVGVPTAREFLWYVNSHRGDMIGGLLVRVSQLFRLVAFVVRRSLRRKRQSMVFLSEHGRTARQERFQRK
jgi:hypothetical protein